jgi:hypothetical protein
LSEAEKLAEGPTKNLRPGDVENSGAALDNFKKKINYRMLIYPNLEIHRILLHLVLAILE